jgi:subtilisin family serine protease
MSRRRAPLLLAFGVAVLVLALVASASAATVLGGSRNESFQSWFVQFKSPSIAKGGSKAALASERAAFYKNAAAQGLTVKQRYAFDDLWNGVSVDVPAAQAGGLATVPGVAAVYPVETYSIAADEDTSDGEISTGHGTNDPDLAFATTMTQAQSANTAGFKGTGIKAAIIDSGFDWKNPDLNPSLTFPGDRLTKGFDFVGDNYDANEANSTFQPVPHPDSDPAPCNPVEADAIAARQGAGPSAAGHGTHVAGIVGAKAAGPNGVTGVAPEVTFFAYRVFGCVGSTDSDIMLAAMERAFNDGAQVVNMSIGSAFVNHPESPTAVGADALAGRGVVVVTSIGNSGANGLYSASAPGVGDRVIGVASVQNLALPALTFNVTGGGTTRQVPYLQLQATQTAPTSGTSGDGTIVFVGRGCVADSSLNPPLAEDDPYLADPNGKIALITRGLCTFATKYHRAVAAGAKAVIVMNDGLPGRVGLFAGGGVVDEGVPGVTISFTDGEAIKALAAPRNLTWTDVRVNAPDPSAGTISDFSSWGTDSHLGLKPDISAPGGNITSTWPMQQFGGHNTISGTSMASPHVAGAAALLLQAGVPPAQIRDRLQNSSLPFANVATAVTEATEREGAGLVQILNAIQAPVRVSPGKISFGQGNGGSQTLTLTNASGSPITYTLAHTTALAVGPTATTQYPFTFGLFAASPTVTFKQGAATVTSVTVPANGSTEVNVTIVPPGYPAKTLWGGFVRFVEGGVTKLRVPYGAFMGDYQSIIAIGNGGCDLPMLVKIGGASDKINCPTAPDIEGLIGQPSGGTWDRPKQDPVVLLYHLDHQVALETVTLVNAATGAPVTQGGRNAVLESNSFLPRNSQPFTFFAFIWDGTQAFTTGNGNVQRKAAPGGVYKLKFTTTKVKALNDNGPAQTETWISPAFTLRDG